MGKVLPEPQRCEKRIQLIREEKDQGMEEGVLPGGLEEVSVEYRRDKNVREGIRIP